MSSLALDWQTVREKIRTQILFALPFDSVIVLLPQRTVSEAPCIPCSCLVGMLRVLLRKVSAHPALQQFVSHWSGLRQSPAAAGRSEPATFLLSFSLCCSFLQPAVHMQTASDGVCAGVALEVLWAQAGHVGSQSSKGGTSVSANQSGVGVVVGFPAALSLQTPSAAQEIIIKWMWTWEELCDAFEQEGKGPVEEIKVLLHPPRAANTIRDFVPPSSWGCNPDDECMEVSRAENPEKFDQVVRDLFTPPLHILNVLPAQRQEDSYSVEV